MTQKFKIKIMRAERIVDSYDDCYFRNVFYPAVGDWEEVTAAEREEIKDAIGYANNKISRDGYYFLVEYSEDFRENVFKSASEFKEKIRKEKEREEKRKEEEKRKRDEKAQERKHKQLEKLKRELGEE